MSPRRTLCGSVLVAEAFVVFFALLVAANLSDLPTATLLAVGIPAALSCLVVAGLLRYRWASAAGSALQVLFVLSGVVVGAMYVVGPLFAALWFIALALASRIEHIQAERAGGPPT